MSNPTTAAAWKQAAEKVRRQQAVELELPSGAVVRAKRPGVETWFLRGRIPESLSGIVLALSGEDNKRRLTAAEQAEIGRFNRSVILAAVVEPRIVEADPGEGEIAFADIPDEDADYLLAWATRGPEVAALESFRRRTGLPPAGDSGPDLRPAAEPDAATDGSGDGA